MLTCHMPTFLYIYMNICICSCMHTCILAYMPTAYIPTFLNACTNAWIYAYMLLYLHAHMPIHIHLCMHSCQHEKMPTWIHANMPTFLCAYVYLHPSLHACMQANMPVYLHAYMCNYIFTYIPVCILFIYIRPTWTCLTFCACWNHHRYIAELFLQSKKHLGPVFWHGRHLTAIQLPLIAVRRCSWNHLWSIFYNQTFFINFISF